MKEIENNSNPFKAIETRKEVPEDLKESVIESVESAKLLMDIGNLFFGKFGKTIESLFKTKKSK